MRSRRPPLFRKRQFEPTIIVTCVRWYGRFSLSLRDLEELMAKRGFAVDHTTIWVQRYGPEVHRRLRGNVKKKSSTWPYGQNTCAMWVAREPYGACARGYHELLPCSIDSTGHAFWAL